MSDPALDDAPARLLGPPWADTTRLGRPFAKDPSVIRFDGRYLLYHSLAPAAGETAWSVGIAASGDLISWELVAALTPFGPYDASGQAAPGAIVIDDRVHLFYQSYGRGADDAICHAWSDDGVHFTPNPENPVFRPSGEWNCGRAIDADLVRFERDGRDVVLLAYATRDPQMRVQQLGTAIAAADSAFGPADWTHLSESGPALAPELGWERDCIEAPALLRRGPMLIMFYAGAYNNEPQQIGWAHSVDGAHWTRGSDVPLLSNGAPGTWNSSESGHPGVLVDDDGQTYLFFQGDDDDGHTWWIAGTRVSWDGDRPLIDRDV